jgi:hypothetical protein
MMMDFMLGACGAAMTNIVLLCAIIFTYAQNLKSIKSHFTFGLVLVASIFIAQNIVTVVLWFNLYFAGLTIKNIVDTTAPYLFFINLAQTCGLGVLYWISRI